MAFILYTCFIVLAANPLISYCNLVTYGTHFKVLYGDKLDNETSDESTPFISQHFHECGMGKACNYVVKQTNTKLYSKVNEEKNLPGNDEIAWKKIASEDTVYRSCMEAKKKGITTNGNLKVYTGFGMPVKVYCDMTTDSGGWTIIQRRVDASTDFNRTWQEYKQGFGDPASNFWIGLDHINSLTSEGRVKLRIELKSSAGDTGYGTYESFKVANEVEKYKLTTLANFTGTIGDSMTDTVGRMFSTWDRDNEKVEVKHCGKEKGAGWWYKNCSLARLNGFYISHPNALMSNRIKWDSWFSTIGYTEMKLRREE